MSLSDKHAVVVLTGGQNVPLLRPGQPDTCESRGCGRALEWEADGGDCYVTCQIPIPSIRLLYKHRSFLCWPETWPVCRPLCISSRGSQCRRVLHTGTIMQEHKKGRRRWISLLEHRWEWGKYFQHLQHTKCMQLIVWTRWIPQSPAFCHIPFWISSSTFWNIQHLFTWVSG